MSYFKALETYASDFKEMCDLGYHYQNEVGTQGVREAALKGPAGALKAAFQKAKGFQTANKTPQSTNVTGVKNLAAFHTSQQNNVKSAEQTRLNMEVINMRKWLSRQGAWFTGEDDINWPQTMRLKVVYDADPALQGATMVKIIGGKLLTADGKLLDTSKMVTHFSGPGAAIYVMSAEGNLHVHSHSVGHYHHSSLLAGGRVAGAGEMKVTAGKITWLSNKSGHYQPGRKNLLQVLAVLQKKGVALDFALTVMPEGTKYGSVHDYMVAQQLDDASIAQTITTMTSILNSVYSYSGGGHYDKTPNNTGGGGNHYDKTPGGGGGGYDHYDKTPNDSHYEVAPSTPLGSTPAAQYVYKAVYTY